jgi:hypothetical protein
LEEGHEKYRALFIVVEGQTEEEFVNEIIRPWMLSHGIHDVRAIKIRTSKTGKGGNSNYLHFKNTTNLLLKQEKDILVTCLVDYFRLPSEFPGYATALTQKTVAKRVTILESELGKDINSPHFIPYIQLHEFEALLFTKSNGFSVIPSLGSKALTEIEAIITKYPNPEDINDHPDTAPSKRIEKLIPSYNKVLFGNYIILENGLSSILDKCPRFKQWLENLRVQMTAE